MAESFTEAMLDSYNKEKKDNSKRGEILLVDFLDICNNDPTRDAV